MTFHGLITGLVVVAVLLGLAALTSWRLSRTEPLGFWLPALGPRYTPGSGGDDFRDWLDEWEWE